MSGYHPPSWLPSNSLAPAPAETRGAELAPITVAPPSPKRLWPLWLALGLGLVGVLGLIGWGRRSLSRPYILEFSPVASQYAIADQKNPLLNWRISHPQQLSTLVLETLTPEGSLVGEPQRYDLSDPLPLALLPYCNQTAQQLSCDHWPTTVRQPGQYRFQLTLLPKSSLNLGPLVATSSLVTITDLPLPTVVELAPHQGIYTEGGQPVPTGRPGLPPPVSQTGIQLSWVIRHPEAMQDLLLVVRQPGGRTVGGRRFSWPAPATPGALVIPEALKPFCQLRPELVCQGVPTGMTAVGRYQFELTPMPRRPSPPQAVLGRISDVVEIQPRPPRIATFTINGREAQPKYLVPVDQGQPLPGFRLDWRVEGGATTQVELLPSPGTVGLRGSLPVPLGPASSTTVTLRAWDGQNPPVVRAVTVETFDPTPQGAGPSPSPTGAASAPPKPASSAQPTPQGRTARSPGLTLPEPQDSGNEVPGLPQDLQNRSPADLNLQF